MFFSAGTLTALRRTTSCARARRNRDEGVDALPRLVVIPKFSALSNRRGRLPAAERSRARGEQLRLLLNFAFREQTVVRRGSPVRHRRGGAGRIAASVTNGFISESAVRRVVSSGFEPLVARPAGPRVLWLRLRLSGGRQCGRLTGRAACRIRIFSLSRHRFALFHMDSIEMHFAVIQSIVEVLRGGLCK